MDKNQIEQILNVLKGISLAEWQRLKVCIDREFNSQSNKLKLEVNNYLREDLNTECIQ